MNFLLKISPDITIKSDYVRKSLIKTIEQNIRSGLKKFLTKEEFILVKKFDRLELEIRNEEKKQEVIHTLSFLPGIAFFWERKSFPLKPFEEIFTDLQPYISEKFENKTFRVTVKRSGAHAFTSMQLEKYLGGAIAQNIPGAKVKLKEFEAELRIEVKDENISLLTNKHEGVGGIPIGAEKRIVSLVSGGFDSGVSSFLMMRKGCPTDFLFFNLGGYDHKEGVKQVCEYMTKKISHGYDPNIIIVPFEKVMKELIENTEGKYRTILLKRCMMRASEIIADDFEYSAIVTGESIAQVSSQTITNLNIIEKSLDHTALFRPLLGYTKQEIITIAKQIGTETFANQMPEFCGVLSKKPSTAAKIGVIQKEEERLSENLIQDAIAQKEVVKISRMPTQRTEEVQSVYVVQPGEIVIDLRKPDEKKNKQAPFPNNEIIDIAFYDINEAFPKLDQSKTYIFFCSKGIMSISHARDLHSRGFKNIKFFKKPTQICSI